MVYPQKYKNCSTLVGCLLKEFYKLYKSYIILYENVFQNPELFDIHE
jgi:hypothetical protein